MSATLTIWVMIVLMAIGTFLLRFSFLALIGKRELSPRVQRLLRYTPVAVIPGLMAPQIFLPELGASLPDPAKLIAAAVTLLVGVWTKNVIAAMVAGVAVLALLSYLM
ncbi:AzlD domain-containing protein [Pararhodobacter oceanensis]|uniref:AzlD domain-containing protein n=1 Tax=Pararhodobacter oceanensis TaxID=2172121 RepID=UPI003A948320